MNERLDGQDRYEPSLVVELFGSDPTGRKMIAWGRRQFRMLNAEC